MASEEDPPDYKKKIITMIPPPILPELRIVLLGENLSDTSSVGNFILRRSAFDTEAPPDSVDQYSERVRGYVDGRNITIIKAPNLYNPEFSPEEVTQSVKECISLSNPGPHAFLLVIKPQSFTEEKRERLRLIVNCFSEKALNYSIIISTDWEDDEAADQLNRDAFHKLTDECCGRHHRFNDNKDQNSVLQLFEEIDQMVKVNGGSHLVCEISEGAEGSVQLADKPERTGERSADISEDKQKDGTLNVTQENKADRPEHESMTEIRSLPITTASQDTCTDQSTCNKGNQTASENQEDSTKTDKTSHANITTTSRISQDENAEGTNKQSVPPPSDSNFQPKTENVTPESSQDSGHPLNTDTSQPFHCHGQETVCAKKNEESQDGGTENKSIEPFKENKTPDQNRVVPDCTQGGEDLSSVKSQLSQDSRDLTLKNTSTELSQIYKHAETDIKNTSDSQTAAFPQMTGAPPKQFQAERCLKNKIPASEASQKSEPSQDDNTEITQLASELPSDDAESCSKSSDMTVVLFGNSSAVHFGDENILLGPRLIQSVEHPWPKKTEVRGRIVSVINLLDLHEDDHSTEPVDHISSLLVNENSIQSFIFILQLRQFTDADKLRIEWLQRQFGESVLSFVVILFTYEREEDCDTIIDVLKKNTVLEQLVEKCGQRYHICSKSMNNQSEMRTLLEKIDCLVSENNQHCYTAEMYNTALKLRNGRRHMAACRGSCTDESICNKGNRTPSEHLEDNEDSMKTHDMAHADIITTSRLSQDENGEGSNRLPVPPPAVSKFQIQTEKVTTESSQDSGHPKYTDTSQPFHSHGHETVSAKKNEESQDGGAENKSMEPFKENKNPDQNRVVPGFTQGDEDWSSVQPQLSQDSRDLKLKNTESTEPSQTDEHAVTDIPNISVSQTDAFPRMTEAPPEQNQTEGCLENKNPASEESQKGEPSQDDNTEITQTPSELSSGDAESSILYQNILLSQETRQMAQNNQTVPQNRKEKITESEMENDGSKCEDKTTEDAKPVFIRLNLMEKQKQKMKTSDVLQLTAHSLHLQEPCTEETLVETFLQRLLMMDYRARYITTKEETTDLDHTYIDTEDGDFDIFFSKEAASFDMESLQHPVHPMDVQMSAFHCSDNFLKQLIVTKLSQCQYALPLLVPDPFTKEIDLLLWTFRQISKTWKITNTSGKEISKTQPVYAADTPMVSFFRFGSVSSSKSQLMNSLINEKHATFFHRHCPGSSRNRLLLDGVMEIAWYCPSGKETDYFSDCVAFCNLHGDAESHKKQLDLLIKMSSVNVVLLSNPEEVTKNEILKNLVRGPKPLICLFSEDKSSVSKNKNRKYRIGLKDRNQSDVTKNLRATIKDCLSKSPSRFRLNDLCKWIKTDEDNPACKRGKEAALEIMRQLENKEISQLKKEHLPCQGQLWHDWCEMNKNLHRLQSINLEKEKSDKQRKMKEIRAQQHNHGLSCTMNLFISSLNHLTGSDKLYFFKWVGILLDKLTSDELSALHYTYNEKWTKVLDLKKKHDKSEKMKEEQTGLEEISQKLNEATFGLEHFLREMGQIYESFISVQKHNTGSSKENVSSLPKLAAELITSGSPIELMDGDATHVPLVWVSAVLDELIKILGDQRVFVLSVLGIQSSGKSTMLNAMFGLQFAVSGGRCTRGAFMQLVRVSEEMKAELKFDYILIVDTEGLRALELAGKSTRHHDNELATFVVGLGNMTLINIFGETPVEMQDILQIVVQAFLRMKKVSLNPRCMFVHQNVGDIMAGEKNMEGRRRLQENLDEMTKLAAKEEDSDAELFSDVISFNVQTDVQYFAQLWEGSPPMAPPNPSYSENILKLKNTIFQKAAMSHCMTLSQFNTRVSDLWEALLNENFVFSFKNTLEIAVYRKLETEFGKWTWSLRSTMLDLEEKLHNRIENKKMNKIEEKDLSAEMKTTKLEVEKSMKQYFEKNSDKGILTQWRVRFETKIEQLHKDLVHDAKRKLTEVIQQQKARESFENKKTQYDEKLFVLSKDLALKLKHKETDEKTWKQEFDKVWDEWVSGLIQDNSSEETFDFWEDVVRILSVGYEEAFIRGRLSQNGYKTIDQSGTYSHYVVLSKQKKQLDVVQNTTPLDLTKENTKDKNDESSLKQLKNTFSSVKPGLLDNHHNQLHAEDECFIRDLTRNIIQETEELTKNICNKIAKLGYKDSYIQELTEHIKSKVKLHEKGSQRIKLRKEFTLDLCLHVCDFADGKFTKIHKQYVDANSVRVYLKKQKPQYYSVFLNYCRGASATAIFGDLICSNLKASIQQAALNKTATDLSTQIRSDMPEFNGNRSQLEKHILKCLAEEENFEKYTEYIHNPKKHFEKFITEKVKQYINENDSTVLKLIKENLNYKEQRVINASNNATEEVKNRGGDADMWLKSFSNSLKDELSFNELAYVDLKEITDLDFLKQIISKSLTDMMSELFKSFNSVIDINVEAFRNKPDEILIEHLCRCCWVQCPFCKAICTNTMEDHDGEHSVPFHRVEGIKGIKYRRTKHLSSDFCTTLVQSDMRFYPKHDTDELVPYKIYRTAGGEYAKWSITPDNSELPYWKWFVCRFQKDLEKYYSKQFQGDGEIPTEWRDFTKEQAIESLDKYI